MLYRFIKKDENVERIGDIDAETLETKLQGYLNDGFELATAEEHDQQVIGAVNKQLEEANAKIAELEAKTAS
jgi:molybdopterin converting factor small subunit